MTNQVYDLFRQIEDLILQAKEYAYDVAEDDAAPEAATDYAEKAIAYLLDVEMGLYEAQMQTLEAVREAEEARDAA